MRRSRDEGYLPKVGELGGDSSCCLLPYTGCSTIRSVQGSWRYAEVEDSPKKTILVDDVNA